MLQEKLPDMENTENVEEVAAGDADVKLLR